MTKKKWMKIFASRVNNNMNIRCINQKELSEATGISKTTISRYLQGRQLPKTDAVLNIAKALDCTVAELIYVDEMIH